MSQTFKVFCPDHGDADDAVDIEAYDAEDAAQKYAENSYNEEPINPSDFEMIVHVENEIFKISAEADVMFYSRKVK